MYYQALTHVREHSLLLSAHRAYHRSPLHPQVVGWKLWSVGFQISNACICDRNDVGVENPKSLKNVTLGEKRFESTVGRRKIPNDDRIIRPWRLARLSERG